MAKKKYYSVRSGRKPGIYRSWADCEKEIKGFSGAEYKKFSSLEEAEGFMLDREEEGKSLDRLGSKEAVAYVDGSYKLASHEYSYGMVFFTDKDKIEEFKKYQDPEMAAMRNVAGEIKGAMAAMSKALELKKEVLYIYYDYMGIEKWAKGEWKRNKSGTIAYKDYYDSIEEDLRVHFIKVKAHTGDKYNEEADSLAKKALGIEG